MHILLIAELVVLVVAVGAVLQVALKPPFRRDLRELPRIWVVVAVVLAVAGLLVGGSMLLRWAPLRHLAVVATLGAWGVAWFRARPGYGVKRGLPPGSLGIAASVDAIYDRGYYAEQVRRYGPVFKMSQFGRPVVCVHGLSRARTLLATQGDALVGAALPYNRALGKGALRYMAADTHQQERPLFREALGAFDAEGCEPAIRRSCRNRLDAMVSASVTMTEGVAARPYFARFLLEALSRIFFGLRADDPRVNTLERILPDIEVGRMGGRAWAERFEAAMVTGTAIMKDLAQEARAGKPSSIAGTTLGALLELDPHALEDATRARNLFITFRLANGDVVGLLDWVFTQLSRHPEAQDAVRRGARAIGESAGSQPRDAGSRVVLETLRLEQSEFLYRRVVRPLVIEGYTIPAGWLLRVLVQESHREPGVFPDPERFDPDRFLLRTYDKTEYSPFGADIHGCMGARLALFLGRVLAEELCHGYEWTVTRDGPLERGTRHRHHWRPSSLRRVVVRERPGDVSRRVPGTVSDAPVAGCPAWGHAG